MTTAISVAARAGAKAVICASTGNTSASAAAYATAAGMTCARAGARRARSPWASSARRSRTAPRCCRSTATSTTASPWPASWPRPTRSSWSTRSTRSASRGRRPRRSRSSTPSATPPTSTACRSATPATSRPTGWATTSTARTPRRRGRPRTGPACGASRPPGPRPIVLGHPVDQPDTIATAIRIGNPASWQQAVAARDDCGGLIDAVTDEQILAAHRLLSAREGVFVEPASAASVAGLLAAAEAGLVPAGAAHRLHRHRSRAQGPAVGAQGRGRRRGAADPGAGRRHDRGRGPRPRGLTVARPWPAGSPPGVLEVRVPGSSANIGPGFDSLGLALGIWDVYRVSVTERPGLEVVLEGEGGPDVPCDERHLVAPLDAPGLGGARRPPARGLRLVCRNTVPHGRGLGSSAAAIVAGVVAAQDFTPLRPTVPTRRGRVRPVLHQRPGQCRRGPPRQRLGQRLRRHDGRLERRRGPRSGAHGAAGRAPRRGPGRPRAGGAAVHRHGPGGAARADRPRAGGPQLPAGAPCSSRPRSPARPAAAGHRRVAAPGAAARRPCPHTMGLVDRLRAHGHAAVVSGAGPSVLVLAATPRRASPAVRALVDTGAWRVLEPGMTSGLGASVQRVTLRRAAGRRPPRIVRHRIGSH